MMLKRFCDRCGVQLESDCTRCVVRFRSGPLHPAEVEVDLCTDCIDKAFGGGFTARITAEYAAKRKAAEEQRKKRLAKKTPAPAAEATDEQEDE